MRKILCFLIFLLVFLCYSECSQSEAAISNLGAEKFYVACCQELTNNYPSMHPMITEMKYLGVNQNPTYSDTSAYTFVTKLNKKECNVRVIVNADGYVSTLFAECIGINRAIPTTNHLAFLKALGFSEEEISWMIQKKRVFHTKDSETFEMHQVYSPVLNHTIYSYIKTKADGRSEILICEEDFSN